MTVKAAQTAGYLTYTSTSSGWLSATGSITVTVASDYTGTMLFQWVSNYSLWITSTTFSSNLAEVDVYDSDIPATSIGISGDDYVVNTTVSTSNSSSSGTDSVTSQFTSTTDPSNATGDITWTTSDSSVATIDNSGLLTGRSRLRLRSLMRMAQRILHRRRSPLGMDWMIKLLMLAVT